MDTITVNNVSKKYKNQAALDDVSFSIEPGSIVGLFGPNGAGKTTLIKALLGLARVEGQIEVLGMEPMSQRHKLMEHVSHIADVATLPGWIKGRQVVDYIDGVHPKFDRDKALRLLDATGIDLNKKVKQLSKGMIVQLHLSCVLAIDVPLLILDEPTLGLDIMYRRQFYEQLITEFFDEQRTILVTSHQIDEFEHVLNRVMFLKNGRLILQKTLVELSEEFVSLKVDEANLAIARDLKPIYEIPGLGKYTLIYQNVGRDQLENLGQLSIPSTSDIFVATMRGNDQ